MKYIWQESLVGGYLQYESDQEPMSDLQPTLRNCAIRLRDDIDGCGRCLWCLPLKNVMVFEQ